MTSSDGVCGQVIYCFVYARTIAVSGYNIGTRFMKSTHSRRKGCNMTETTHTTSATAVQDPEIVLADVRSQGDAIAEAITMIDKALAEMLRRELVSAGEVGDLLLDLRSLLTSAS
jgi:hypothetical protein